MSQTGMGVMINQLFGSGNGAELFQAAKGKKIASIALAEERLRLAFEDGTRIEFHDDGQSCCESRYMRTDDDLAYHVGASLLDAELAPGSETHDDSGAHEIQFLKVTTSKGVITVASHNEHNGYYGGFYIKVTDGTEA